MCGIVGIVGWDAPLPRVEAVVRGMNARIAHRGPDGDGLAAHPEATIAMKRLAIVDVAHGQQPMANDDGSVVLVYNGEIYNAPALRRELERTGTRFRTRSDTEVILRLYEREPNDVERHLAGMWAFAIHDRRRRRFVLSRDRFGIKPLFVADTGRALAFASELRAFDRSLEPFASLFELDSDAAHGLLSWNHIPGTATIYRGVRRLAPATRLTINLENAARDSATYWRLIPSPSAAAVRTLADACDGTEEVLRRAVKEHLESDVPVATFLSGGIDSALVTAYANDAAPGAIKAYTIGFAESRFDESPFARATAERLGVPIAVASFDESTARAMLPDALLAYDEPFGDSSSLATYLLSAHVGRDYKVALGGDGGDEVFAGYMKYAVAHLRAPFARTPRLREAIGGVASRFPRLRVTRRIARGLDGSDARVYADLTQVTPLAVTAALVRRPAPLSHFLGPIEERFANALGSELQRTLACDLAGPLTDDMLVKVDRASMARHLEARVPFLDHRVAEWGVGLSSAYTLGRPFQRWSGKRVLRALHERRFGPALANRKKQGFGIPVERWLRGPFDDACTRLFARDRLDRFDLLVPAELSDGAHRRWLDRDPYVLWHAFALAAWCEATLGDGPDALRALLTTG